MKNTEHIDLQKYGERFALNILTDKLSIPRDSIIESESPDFIFEYEGKKIGAEVVEYHRDPKETEARKAYQKAIDEYKGKRGKITSITVFDENIRAFNGKKSKKQLLEEIDNLLSNPDNDALNLEAADEWDLDSESELPVSVCSIGICQHVLTDVLEKVIRNKEKKLTTYKCIHDDFDEFWLIVYVDQYEYDYFEKMEKPKVDTFYDRIYLTHIVDGILEL